MPVVEGGDQPDLPRQQHAVAEHVARHVAHAHDRELLGLRVDAEFAEVTLHAFPGAARGDAHGLVVVADAAARSEGIAEPVAVLGGDGVRVVGKGGRALVGRHHQVRVVAVQTANQRRRRHLAGDEVVGQVEQRTQIVLVAGHALLEIGLAIGGWRCLLQHEAALGSHRHDDGVLHHLRLHQAEHLGAEVLRPVAPAQPATRHLAATQVNAFETRRVDEDLVERPRAGQAGHLGRIELQAQEAAPLARRAGMADAGAPVVGAQGGPHQRQQLAQHAILVEVADTVERLLDGIALRSGAGVVVRRGVQAQVEQLDQHARDVRLRRQRRLDRGLRQREADLLQELGIGAQHDDVPRRHAGKQHQAVEVIVLHLATEDPRKRAFEQARQHLRLDRVGHRGVELEVVHRDETVVAPAVADAEVVLAHHTYAHVLEHRQAVRQHHRRAQPIDLEAQGARAAAQWPVQGQAQALFGRQRGDLQDIGHGGARLEAFPIDLRKGCAPALEELHAAPFADLVDECVAQFVVPAARGRRERGFDLAAVDGRHLARLGAYGEVHPRQQRLAEQHVEIGAKAGKGVHQDGLELLAQLGGIGFARHVHQAGDEAVVGVAPDEQSQALAFAGRQDAQRGVVKLVLADLEQVVTRIGRQDVLERLGQVAAHGQRRARRDGRHLLAQQRDLDDPCAVRGGAEQADETVLADDLAGGVVSLHADIVAVARAVHGRARVRARDEQHRRGRAGHRAGLRGHGGEAGGHLLPRLTQHAQRAATHQAQHVLTLIVHQVVTPIAEQREVVVGQPLQEGAAFLRHLRRHRRRGLPQFVGGLLQVRQHRLPVAHCGAYVAEHALQAGRQRRARLRIDQPVHLDMHP